MGIIVSHQSALRCLRAWEFLPHTRRAPFCPDLPPSDRGSETTDVRAERPTPRQVKALLRVPAPFADAEADREAPDSSLFGGHVHILVAEPGLRSQAKGAVSHVYPRPIPRDLLYRAQEGLYLTGPDLCFALMAAELGTVDLALLGNELVGSYAPYPPSPYGIVERTPLTSLDRLRRTVGQLGGRRGCARARACLELLLPGAASPMESRLALYLTLPRHLGGYGLPAPMLNMTFDADGRTRRLDAHRYRGDLCWPEARVAVEYDSDAAHTGSQRIAEDTRRRNELVDRGITVVGVTRQQAHSFHELDRVAHVVARLLGHRMRERRSDQPQRRLALFTKLFGPQRSQVE